MLAALFPPPCAVSLALLHRHVFLLCVVFLLCGAGRLTRSDDDIPGAPGGDRPAAGRPDNVHDRASPVNSSGDAGLLSPPTTTNARSSKLLAALASGGVEQGLPPPTAGQGGSSGSQVDNNSSGDAGPVSATQQSPSSKRKAWYSTADWLPSQGVKPDRTVNLAVLPMLALFFFLFGVCIKCYSWMREQDRTKARGQLDFEDVDAINYGIITAGEQGFREVDIRSDCTSMYDTVTSFRSFRLPFNEQHTVTSVKSLPNQPYDTYRSIVLQRADEGVYDSVHSYKAFLEKSVINEVDIEVELVNDYTPSSRPRSKSYDQCLVRTSQEAGARSKRRRLRHHSGGRGLEGSVKMQAERERERHRRHSDKTNPTHPHPTPNPESVLRGKTFHRRSSPALLEPLLQGTEFKIPLELSDEEEGEGGGGGEVGPLSSLDRQSSHSSSSSAGGSSHGSPSQLPHHHPLPGSHPKSSSSSSSHRQRREKLRQRRGVGGGSSQDRLAERAVKGSSHSSGHCSDDDNSPQSSSSSSCPEGRGSSSNELDSESDVTDSGLVVDLLHKPAKHSCFKTRGKDKGKSSAHKEEEESPSLSSPSRHQGKVKGKGKGKPLSKEEGGGKDKGGGSSGGGGGGLLRKVHRFKVSFVDDATLSAASE